MNKLSRTIILATMATVLAALRHNRKRSFLTMLAIAIGIAAVITISAAGRGVERFVLGQLDAFGPDTVSIETHVPHSKQSSSPVGSVGITITTLKARDLKSIGKHPNIAAAYGMVMGQDTVQYGGELKKIMLAGHGHQMPEVEAIRLSEGRFFTEGEDESLAQVAVLGSTAKDNLFGADSAVDKTIYIRGKPFRVVGALEPRGQVFFFDMDNIIVLPVRTMQKKLLGIDYYQSIIARMRSGENHEQTKSELTTLLRAAHDIETTDTARDDFMVNMTADAQRILTTVTGGITLLLIALVCISLVVGGVGIMNIMYVSVAERSFEIGLRKSLGASRRRILWQFLGEAIALTLGGGVAGVLIGALLALLIYALAVSFGLTWVYSIPLSSVFLSVIFSAAIGILFGFYPAKRAAGLSPIEALRKE